MLQLRRRVPSRLAKKHNPPNSFVTMLVQSNSPKLQHGRSRVAFTGYSDFSERFWPAGQLTPNRFWPAGTTKQEWIILQHIQYEQIQNTHHQKHDVDPLGSDTRMGPHASRDARAGMPALQKVYVSNYLTSNDPHQFGLCRGYVVSFAFGVGR